MSSCRLQTTYNITISAPKGPGMVKRDICYRLIWNGGTCSLDEFFPYTVETSHGYSLHDELGHPKPTRLSLRTASATPEVHGTTLFSIAEGARRERSLAGAPEPACRQAGVSVGECLLGVYCMHIQFRLDSWRVNGPRVPCCRAKW